MNWVAKYGETIAQLNSSVRNGLYLVELLTKHTPGKPSNYRNWWETHDWTMCREWQILEPSIIINRALPQLLSSGLGDLYRKWGEKNAVSKRNWPDTGTRCNSIFRHNRTDALWTFRIVTAGSRPAQVLARCCPRTETEKWTSFHSNLRSYFNWYLLAKENSVFAKALPREVSVFRSSWPKQNTLCFFCRLVYFCFVSAFFLSYWSNPKPNYNLILISIYFWFCSIYALLLGYFVLVYIKERM